MRIAFVIASLNSGGAERVIANLANCFVSQKDEIDLILLMILYIMNWINVLGFILIKEDKRGIPLYIRCLMQSS